MIDQIDRLAGKIRETAVTRGYTTLAREITTTQIAFIARMNEALGASTQVVERDNQGSESDSLLYSSGYGYNDSGVYTKIFMIGEDGFGTNESWIL